MARPKEFDVDEALDRAMDLFWVQGYEATSMQDLQEHMRIGRQSLYDTFGGKHELFLAALERYRTQIGEYLKKLEAPDASLPAIRGYFEDLVEFYAVQPTPRACLLTNSTVELAAHDEEVAKRLSTHLLRVEAAFLHAINNGIEKGELRRGDRPRALARHLTNAVLGLGVYKKGGATRKTLRDAATVALSVLR